MGRGFLPDVPTYLLVATIWAYWVGVGIMVVRVRRKTRNPAGLVPKERLERLMWLIWVPLVMAWMALPFLATTQGNPLLAVSPVAVLHPVLVALR